MVIWVNPGHPGTYYKVNDIVHGGQVYAAIVGPVLQVTHHPLLQQLMLQLIWILALPFHTGRANTTTGALYPNGVERNILQ